MAEYVHQTLEEMIPELEEMNKIGLFTVKETKIILKNRQNHEYKLRQVTKTKPSFLNYIEYEKKLLELLKIRRKKQGHASDKHEIEKSIADRIHKLYRLLTTRFGEDITLWQQHIDFTKIMNEKGYVTRLYTQALKLHSRNEDLWVKAAQWESSQQGNCNPELARELLLKAQRINPESEPIFLEMFRMELELAKQILKRKAILGISATEENKEDNGAEEDKTLELKLAEIVYSKGVELFPGNAEFHMKLLNICSWFKMAKKLQETIANDLQRLYPHTPAVWSGLALRHLNNFKKLPTDQQKEAIQQCIDVYAEAVERMPNEEMWSLCLRGHLNILQLRQVKDGEWILKNTLTMFEKSLQLGTLSEDLFMDLLDLLRELCMTEDLARVAARGTDLHPSSSRLWLARLKVMGEEAGDVEGMEKLLRTALKQVPAEASWPLWEFVLNHSAAKSDKELEGLMERACRSVTPEVCKPAKEWSLHWTYRHGGLKGARNVYSSLKTMRPISVEFYRLYIQIESSQVEPNMKKIRAAFEEALVEFGQLEPDVWLNYMEAERVVGKDSTRSGVIQQRALHGLDSHLKESFIRKGAMLGLRT